MSRLRGQFSELIGLPIVASLLPWRWFYRLARQLSRLTFLFREATDQAVAAADASGQIQTDRVWRRHYRLNKLIDSVDPWLSRARSDRWMRRHLEVVGNWPVEQPFAAVSLHWGTGLWALRHLRREAAPVSMILRPMDEWGGAFSAPMRTYLQHYEQEIARAGGAPITATGPGLTQRVSEVFDASHNLLVLLDVPKGANRDSYPVNFLDRPTYFASGVINMVLEQQRPIIPYAIGLDFATGRRRLEICPPLSVASTRQAMEEMAVYFDRVVRSQSSSWHFWPLHQAFLSPDFSMGPSANLPANTDG